MGSEKWTPYVRGFGYAKPWGVLRMQHKVSRTWEQHRDSRGGAAWFKSESAAQARCDQLNKVTP